MFHRSSERSSGEGSFFADIGAAFLFAFMLVVFAIGTAVGAAVFFGL